MGVPLRKIRDRVRMRLRDTDSEHPSFTSIEVDQAVCESYLTLQSRLQPPDLYTAGGLTIAAGGDTFQLPATVVQYTGGDGGAEYAGDVRIRLASNGQFLIKQTVEELDAWRQGSPTVHLAIPHNFALWEEKDQDVQGRCWPGARVAEVCDLFVALSADDLRDFVGSGAQNMDDVEVLFSRVAANALVLYVAADLLTRMTDEDLRLRKLNPQVVPLWQREAEVLLYQEAARRHDLEGIGRVQRWVS